MRRKKTSQWCVQCRSLVSQYLPGLHPCPASEAGSVLRTWQTSCVLCSTSYQHRSFSSTIELPKDSLSLSLQHNGTHEPEGRPAASAKPGQESRARPSGTITPPARGPSDSWGGGVAHIHGIIQTHISMVKPEGVSFSELFQYSDS